MVENARDLQLGLRFRANGSNNAEIMTEPQKPDLPSGPPGATLEQQLTQWLQAAFVKAYPGQEALADQLFASVATDEQFGHYQCNAAMGLARHLRQSPRAIADALSAVLPPHPALASVEVAGPGFINLTLSEDWMSEALAAMDDDARLLVPEAGKGRTILFDYSSPNIAKPMHIGHIRSTVIGNALDRLHRFLGFTVISDNHLGDWGTQFGILILGYRNFLDEAQLARDPIGALEALYVKSNERKNEDPEWQAQARQELVKLQQGDPDSRALWETFVALSMKEFNRIYDRLDIRFDLCRGESYYHDQLPAVLDRLRAQGLVEESDGAQVVRLDEEKLPLCIVRKSDGAFNYATTDIATVLARVEAFAPEAIVYVTDERQQLHFKQFFTICRKLGIQTELRHVWFGLMRLPEGTFSTRDGNVIKLERLLDEAEERALQLIQSADTSLSDEEKRAIARTVGLGAVKYADLSQNPQSLVTFTWEKALALDGNSAPYLQYACVRARGVLRKYQESYPDSSGLDVPMHVGEPAERDVAVRLLRFPDALTRATLQYRPNLLADYLFDLAQAYSRFYQTVPFLQAPEGIRESRIRLSLLVARTLEQGLNLLGIQVPERM